MSGPSHKTHSWAVWILDRPKTIYAIALLLSLLAVVVGLQVEFRNSRSELAPDDDPDQQRWNALLAEYEAADSVIACVEAIDGQAAVPGELLDSLAAAFERLPEVTFVNHRLDVDWLAENFLWLLPQERLKLGGGDDWAPFLAEIGALQSLADVNEWAAKRIEDGRDPTAAMGDDGTQVLELFATWLRLQRDWIVEPEQAARWLEQYGDPTSWVAGQLPYPGGRLQSRDGKLFFLLLSTPLASDELSEKRALLAALGEASQSVLTSYPGYRVAFTGTPATVVDEMTAVRRDSLRSALIAVIGVGILTLFVFRWWIHALWVVLALAAGVLWSFGAVYFELGYLNMITSSFISTLVGVGVAYGIHPISEFELLDGPNGHSQSRMAEALGRTGGAVSIAAITTSAAFFSILLMRFRGFAELGLVAGVGVLLCWLAALTLLPVLVVSFWRARSRSSRAHAVSTGRAPSIDRVWGEQLAAKLCLAPGWVLVGAAALTTILGWQAAGLTVDTNLFKMLPRDAESLRYQRRMIEESDLSPLFGVVRAESLEELKLARERAAAEPQIARFVSVLDLLPADMERAQLFGSAVLAAIERRAELAPQSSSPERLLASLERLEVRLANAADDAFAAGLGEISGLLEEARSAAEEALAALAEASPESQARLMGSERELFGQLDLVLEGFARSLRAGAPSVDSVPTSMRSRLVTSEGDLLGLMYADGELFDPQRLDEFVAAARRVSPEATGFPIVFHKMSGRIVDGFGRAVLMGAGIVFLLLLVDLRSLRDALLAMVPLILGAVWMVGAMQLLGISFNFANLVGVPLIIGVGIDNGVHIMRRVRLQPDHGMGWILSRTGRAILIASLTTMIGFGSLAFASHRGMASLGIVLFIGVATCWLNATLVLPNLLVFLGRVER